MKTPKRELPNGDVLNGSFQNLPPTYSNQSDVPPIKRKKVILECVSRTPFNVFRNQFRRMNENFMFIPEKSCVIAPAPRRPNVKTLGVVAAYNPSVFVAISDSEETSLEYAAWMRKKMRAHRQEEWESTQILNVPGRYDLPRCSTFDLQSIHDHIEQNFPECKQVWDPEVLPVLGISLFHTQDVCVANTHTHTDTQAHTQDRSDTSGGKAIERTPTQTDDLMENKNALSPESSPSQLTADGKSSTGNSFGAGMGKGLFSPDGRGVIYPVYTETQSSTDADVCNSFTHTHTNDDAHTCKTPKSEEVETKELPKKLVCSYLISTTSVIINHAKSEADLNGAWFKLWGIISKFISPTQIGHDAPLPRDK